MQVLFYIPHYLIRKAVLFKKQGGRQCLFHSFFKEKVYFSKNLNVSLNELTGRHNLEEPN